MTAIGKLLVLSALFAGLALLTWSVSLYVERPGWFAPPAEEVDKGNKPVNFKQMKTEIDNLSRAAAATSEAWGTHLKLLEAREDYRAKRKQGYAERLQWARKGNPRDPVDPTNPKSLGKGFYEPVIDPVTKLYDLSKGPDGKPKGQPILGTDGKPLPGLDGLLVSVAADAAEIVNLSNQKTAQERELAKLDTQVIATEQRLFKMNEIRNSVQAELFFLSTFEVNVYETRATVFRRERQLRERLRILGVTEP